MLYESGLAMCPCDLGQDRRMTGTNALQNGGRITGNAQDVWKCSEHGRLGLGGICSLRQQLRFSKRLDDLVTNRL